MTRSRRLAFALLLCLIPLTALADGPSAAQAARADIKGMFGFVPGFLNSMPDSALPGAWEEMKTVQMNPNTALPGKIKEMIGLAVAAQVPCKYCVYAHTEFGKLNGATDTEIAEAVVIAALTRHWSTFLQGTQTDLAKFRGEVAKWLEYAKKASTGKVPPSKPVNVVDAASAMQDVQQSFGSIPEFIKKFPPEGVAGAWKEDRDVEMSPTTALSGKNKSLIGLAVASQIPCRYCVIADTEFARMEGATDREIHEAVAMAAITRHWSTWLNGMQTDEKAFQKDVDHLVKAAKKMAVAAAKKPAVAPVAARPAAPATAPTTMAAKPAAAPAAAPATMATRPAAAPAAAPAAMIAKPAVAAPATMAARPAAAAPPPATMAAAPAPAKPATAPAPAPAPMAAAKPAAPAPVIPGAAPTGTKPAPAIAAKPAAPAAAAAKPAPAAPAMPPQK